MTQVVLNNIDHADLRVRLERGAAFGDAVNQAVVFPTEFEALQREYVILFRRDAAGAWRSTVLLGLDAGENLFLDGERWDAQTIPALMLRGPFSIGVPRPGEPGEPMIHVDPEHPRIARDEGAPLFLEHGGNSPYLELIAGVLQTIFVGDQANPAMFAAFEAAGLLEQVTLDVELTSGRRYTIPDCYTIDAARLAQLDGAALEALHRNDFLRCAIWQQSSLGNLSRLVARKERREV
ncbi:SapC family protein [Sphingomonas psychrotolerans]|uniref:SapC family protein n=1 Tax=Sphingomonas psychrotolerans TaxID=1327635 RepID=A0ABU3N8S4_9SPHN|nr:SapC family protein [Sphingomonas psychrotolerans]MDT8760917.1 SapC family protein [Sphingomonas psychrotolerans]